MKNGKNIFELKPKLLRCKHKGQSILIEYDIENKQWTWQVEVTKPMLLKGVAKTVEKAQRYAREKIDKFD